MRKTAISLGVLLLLLPVALPVSAQEETQEIAFDDWVVNLPSGWVSWRSQDYEPAKALVALADMVSGLNTELGTEISNLSNMSQEELEQFAQLFRFWAFTPQPQDEVTTTLWILKYPLQSVADLFGDAYTIVLASINARVATCAYISDTIVQDEALPLVCLIEPTIEPITIAVIEASPVYWRYNTEVLLNILGSIRKPGEEIDFEEIASIPRPPENRLPPPPTGTPAPTATATATPTATPTPLPPVLSILLEWGSNADLGLQVSIPGNPMAGRFNIWGGAFDDAEGNNDCPLNPSETPQESFVTAGPPEGRYVIYIEGNSSCGVENLGDYALTIDYKGEERVYTGPISDRETINFPLQIPLEPPPLDAMTVTLEWLGQVDIDSAVADPDGNLLEGRQTDPDENIMMVSWEDIPPKGEYQVLVRLTDIMDNPFVGYALTVEAIGQETHLFGGVFYEDGAIEALHNFTFQPPPQEDTLRLLLERALNPNANPQYGARSFFGNISLNVFAVGGVDLYEATDNLDYVGFTTREPSLRLIVPETASSLGIECHAPYGDMALLARLPNGQWRYYAWFDQGEPVDEEDPISGEWNFWLVHVGVDVVEGTLRVYIR